MQKVLDFPPKAARWLNGRLAQKKHVQSSQAHCTGGFGQPIGYTLAVHVRPGTVRTSRYFSVRRAQGKDGADHA
jgi:hypothetical protein